MGDFRRQLCFFLIGISFFLSSCSRFSTSKAPIILILLDSLTEQDYLCSSTTNNEVFTHLQQECEQFIRFTHAFAPSNLLQPNVASLMTGREVTDHRIYNNGSSLISGRQQTLAEVAISEKNRTAFFSGGIPLLPKFGLTQGYERFNDGFNSNEAKLFVPMRTNIEKLLSWIDSEVGSQNFFATLYVPDLLYKNIVTKNDLDEERSLGRKSMLLEINESIDFLIAELKERKLWESSHIIFLGITGEPVPINSRNSLSAHHFHMPLQIKMSKSIDHNLNDQKGQIVSFSQLGQWIEKLIHHKSKKDSLLLSSPKEELFISQENRLLQWLGLSSYSHLGMRKRQYLFSYNPKLKVYDSFYDKKEIEPLEALESDALQIKFEMSQKFHTYFPRDCQASTGKDCHYVVDENQIQSLAKLYQWNEGSWNLENPVDLLNERIQLLKNNPNRTLIQWLAYQALYEKKWTSLFELGKLAGDTSWMLISQLNLRENIADVSDKCLRYFIGDRKNLETFYQNCQNPGLRRVVDGLRRLKLKQRPAESFWAEVSEIKSRRKALSLNLKMHFVNHLRNPFEFSPRLSELYFFLPENSEYQDLIHVDEG